MLTLLRDILVYLFRPFSSSVKKESKFSNLHDLIITTRRCRIPLGALAIIIIRAFLRGYPHSQMRNIRALIKFGCYDAVYGAQDKGTIRKLAGSEGLREKIQNGKFLRP